MTSNYKVDLATSPKPLQQTERALILDVLRGFAILGIFIMNLWAFTFYFGFNEVEKSSVVLARFDKQVTFLMHMFLEGKFYSLFSMLFGIGFAIYLSKVNTDKIILPLFRRRLFVLLVLGFCHLLLWSGDIVTFYALLGFVLIPFRKFSNKTLLVLALVCIVLPVPLYALKMWQPAVFNPGQYLVDYNIKLDAQSGINNERELTFALKGNDFRKILQVNLHGIIWRFGDLLIQDRIFKVFGMFLIGLVIGRTKIYEHLEQNKKLLWRILLLGAGIGLSANFLMTIFIMKGGYYQLTMNGLYQTIAYSIGVAPLALAYASLFAIFYLYKNIRNYLNKLAPVGRMALTNYIIHTIIGLIAFTQLGFGLSSLGPTAWTLFALVVFILQVVLSNIWLHYFNYGPLEWVWRQLTYGKRLPLKKKKLKENNTVKLNDQETVSIIETPATL